MRYERRAEIARLEAQREWYALQVTPQKELATQKLIERFGFTTFVPVEHKWRFRNKYSKIKVRISYPMFPRYVLIGFEAGARWFAPVDLPNVDDEASVGQVVITDRRVLPIFGLQTVTGCVGLRGEPKPLRTKEVQEFILKFPDGLSRPPEQQYMPSNKEFELGGQVRVRAGTFDGITAPIVEINAKAGRGKILAELFGSEREIEIDLFDLEAAE